MSTYGFANVKFTQLLIKRGPKQEETDWKRDSSKEVRVLWCSTGCDLHGGLQWQKSKQEESMSTVSNSPKL
jgi:hypothetical protein